MFPSIPPPPPAPCLLQCSPEDALSPVDVQVIVSFEGVPIQTADGLVPQLASGPIKVTDHKLNFEIDCGEDKVCEDNVRVDISGSSTIEVGIAQEMNVTVMVENRGENSYNTRVSLSYPHGLSYRTFTKTQGRVECSSLDHRFPNWGITSSSSSDGSPSSVAFGL
ncbi:integrin alpha-D-like [Clupea harengus]|uniref:Integrin alpha-D-like n=1 Tax=Clupea harengus TaxID=7950 RepID=A0A6P8FT75_CLUHA|nr:integrin alpha-D-like [Clupea harengus]